VEASPTLCDKRDDIYEDRNETKKASRKICIGDEGDLEALEGVYRDGT
jgi:hypothetical protein